MEARVVVEDGAIVQEEGDRSDVPWWSVTKMAIAAATLTVVGEGRLDLDAPLAGRPDTLRQLLQHRAGLRESAKADQLIYAPGTDWNYSNIGFFFVRELLEQTTGAPLGPLLERRVLQPLGLLGVRLADRQGQLAPDYDPGLDVSRRADRAAGPGRPVPRPPAGRRAAAAARTAAVFARHEELMTVEQTCAAMPM